MAPPFPTKFALAALVAALAVSAAAADRKTLELTATATTATELALGFDPAAARRRALKGEYNPSFDDDEEYEYEAGYDGEDYDYYDEYDYTGDDDLGDYIADEFPEDSALRDPEDAMDDGDDGEGPVGELVGEAEDADDTPFEENTDLGAELEVLDVIERSGGGGGSF